jgi:hypothetical protein
MSHYLKFAPLILCLALAGCGPSEFDFTPAGTGNTVRVTNNQDSLVTIAPVQYRMRAVESHLVLWIENPTDQPIDIIGDKSSIEDPAGEIHNLDDQEIAPHSSQKLVMPPLPENDHQAPQNTSQPHSQFDQPGFIAVPDTNTPPTDEGPAWKWDDDLEIHVDLLFKQGDHQFEQNFSVTRVHKQ